MIDEDTRLQIFKKGRTGGEDIALNVGNPILEEINEFPSAHEIGAQKGQHGGYIATRIVGFFPLPRM